MEPIITVHIGKEHKVSHIGMGGHPSNMIRIHSTTEYADLYIFMQDIEIVDRMIEVLTKIKGRFDESKGIAPDAVPDVQLGNGDRE